MPPSNGGYFVAAYLAAAIVFLAYAMSIAIRTRRLRARREAASAFARERP